MPVKPKGSKTQIRTKKDTNRKEVADLKAENQELKRTVARLRKELGRGIPEVDEVIDEERDDNVERCKFCRSANLKIYHNMAGRRIVLCGDCTQRQSKAVTPD